MKLTFRFVVLVLALLSAVGASALAGTRAISSLGGAMDAVVNGDVRRVLAITHARRVFRSMTLLERDLISATTSAERATHVKKMASLGQELATHLREYERTMPLEDRGAIEKIKACRLRWLELDAEVVRAAEHDGKLALELTKRHQADPVSWETAIGGLVKLSEQRLDQRIKLTNLVAGRARSTLIAVSAIAAALTAALGSMIFLAIRRNLLDLVQINGELEQRVEARTEQLAARERSLRVVLDSTGDGLVTADLKGAVRGECSAAAVSWFGAPEEGQPIWQYLLPHDRAKQTRFQVGFEQLGDGGLPWDAAVGQMPARVERDGRIFELHFMPIREREQLQRILLSARDVTERERSVEAENATREQHALITHLVSDKAGFVSFVHECDDLFARLRDARDVAESARHLHTLKGNVGLFGIQSVARACHALEERLADEGRSPSTEEIDQLWELWRSKFKSVEQLLWKVERGTVEIETAEHARLVRSLVEHREYTEILQLVERWSWLRTSVRLRRLATQAEYLAAKLGKEIKAHVIDNDVRIPEGYLASFWPTLSHVVRNAVDHGLEESEERLEAGKELPGQIWFETRLSDDHLTLEIRDDGRGIDREALLQRAQELGLDVSERTPLSELLFRAGLSSRAEATEISGRGVGLAATKAACEAENGTISVSTNRGKGTTFTLRFRRPAVTPHVHDGPAHWSSDPHESTVTRVATATVA